MDFTGQPLVVYSRDTRSLSLSSSFAPSSPESRIAPNDWHTQFVTSQLLKPSFTTAGALNPPSSSTSTFYHLQTRHLAKHTSRTSTKPLNRSRVCRKQYIPLPVLPAGADPERLPATPPCSSDRKSKQWLAHLAMLPVRPKTRSTSQSTHHVLRMPLLRQSSLKSVSSGHRIAICFCFSLLCHIYKGSANFYPSNLQCPSITLTTICV